MEKGIRMQITLAPVVAEKLDLYCKNKGVKRSAVLALALDKFLREEEADKNK